MTRIPLLVEGCAGTAALSLALQFGLGCRPPVSRMGSKSGYALAVLRVLGLRPGQGADSYLWAEPDTGCRALLHAYADPALMREAAAIIRGWRDEDPRALWSRLREEGPIKDFGAREVGRHVLMGVWSYRQSEPESGFIGPGQRRQDTTATATATATERIAQASEAARWMQLAASNRLINLDPTTLRNTGQGGTTFGGAEFATPAETVADAAREVARWGFLATTHHEAGMLRGGFVHPEDGGRYGAGREATADKMDHAAVGLPATIVPDIREIDPAGCPEGTVCYLDYPYLGDGSQKITGYSDGLTLAEQVEIARRWDAAGAVVCVSECVSRVADFGAGWWDVDITSTRVGQRRSFSTELGRTEWLTLNRPPAWKPAVQTTLFGATP